MPTYQYRCKDCDNELEVVQKFTDDALTECPACDDGELRKVFNAVGVVFKGSGFYRTDSRSAKSGGDSAGKSAEKSAAPAKSGESAGSGSAGSSSSTSGSTGSGATGSTGGTKSSSAPAAAGTSSSSAG